MLHPMDVFFHPMSGDHEGMLCHGVDSWDDGSRMVVKHSHWAHVKSSTSVNDVLRHMSADNGMWPTCCDNPRDMTIGISVLGVNRTGQRLRM